MKELHGFLVTAINADRLFYLDHATSFSSHLDEAYYSNDSQAESG